MLLSRVSCLSLVLCVSLLSLTLADSPEDAAVDSTEKTVEESLEETPEDLSAEAPAENASESSETLAAGVNFLKKNDILKQGTEGLQVRVLKSGPTSGASPQASDSVLAHYEGILATPDDKGNAVKFDSSYDRGSPSSFPLRGVIRGWTDILQAMHVGDKWEVYIPSSLGYGASGSGKRIPPSSDLIFIIELIEVQPPRGRRPPLTKEEL